MTKKKDMYQYSVMVYQTLVNIYRINVKTSRYSPFYPAFIK